MLKWLDLEYESNILFDWSLGERKRGIEDPKIDTFLDIHCGSIGRGYRIMYEEPIIKIETNLMSPLNQILTELGLDNYEHRYK